jgi:hypothetical protein
LDRLKGNFVLHEGVPVVGATGIIQNIPVSGKEKAVYESDKLFFLIIV